MYYMFDMDDLNRLTALGRSLGGDGLSYWGPTILTVAPSLLFVPLALTRLFELCSTKLHVSQRSPRLFPLIAIAINIYMNIAELIQEEADGVMVLKGRIATTSALIAVSAALVLVSSLLEDLRRVRPSALLNGYLVITSIFEAFACICWSKDSTHPRYSISSTLSFGAATTAIGVKLAGAITTRQKWLFWDSEERRIETATDFFSLTISHWIRLSTLSKYALAQSPGQEGTSIDFEIRGLSGTLVQEYNLTKRLPIFLRVVIHLFWQFSLSLWPQLCLVALQGVQYVYFVALLQRIYSNPTAYENEGIVFSSICAAIFLAMAIFTCYAGYYNRRAAALTRSFLSQLIFDKMTTLTATTSDDASATTLMGTDLVALEEAVRVVQSIWLNPIKVLFACWLGSQVFTQAFFIPVIIFVSASLIFALMIGLLNSREFQWMDRLQDRLKLTIATITNLRAMRLQITSEDSALFIQALREDEVFLGSKSRKTTFGATAMGFIPSLLLPSFTFIFTHKANDMTTMYASIFILVSIMPPLASLYQSIPAIMGGIVSYRRMLAYMRTTPQADYRKPLTEEARLPYAEVAFDLHDASFGWSREEMVLNGLCLRIPRGCMTMIVGPCASGKSTLCNALLGEVPIARGSVKTPFYDKPSSYCAQSPFIMDATFQENITGFSNFDQDRYDEAIWATMLEDDAARLPLGHDTMVGDQTGILNTGVRARLSLARAIYAGNELVIFDNALHGLDLPYEDEVFARVFGPDGVLTERGCTVIFVTHWMHHVVSASHIIALGDRGVVQEQGSLPMLLEQGGYLFDLAVSYRTPQRVKPDGLDGTTRFFSGRAAHPTKVETATKVANQGKMANDNSKVASYYWDPANYDWGLAIGLLASLYMLLASFLALWLSLWANPLFGGSLSFYVYYYGFLRGMELFLMSVICSIVISGLTSAPSRVIHKNAIRTVCLASPNYVAKCKKGALLSYFVQDVVFMDRIPGPTFINIIINLGILLGAISSAAVASSWTVLFYPVIVVLLLQVQIMLIKSLRLLREAELSSRDTLYTQLIDLMGGLSTIRCTGWIGDQKRRHNSLVDSSQRKTFFAALAQEWAHGAAILFVGIGFTGLSVVGLRSRDQSGMTATFLITLTCVIDTFPNMFQCFSSVEVTMGSLRRLFELHHQVKPENEGETSDYPGYNWPAGAVKIQSVSASYMTTKPFNYRPGEPPVKLALNNLTLNITSTEKVALTGRSGSGKTSLLHLLLRVLDPIQGDREVRIDGKRLSQLRRDKARRQVLALPFESVFLPGNRTIRENMTLNTRLRDQDSIEALTHVGLKDWLDENGGLDATFAPYRLSKGQQTLFGLARLILVQRQLDDGYHSMNGLLMLEEVDAHLDHNLRGLLRTLLRGRLRPCTLILTSHRLDLARDVCDRVVRMDHGRVIKDGNFAVMCEAHKVKGPCWGDGESDAGH